MKEDNSLIIVILIITLLYLGTSLFYNTSKSCDVVIDYDATINGVNSTNATLPEVKLACYKICIDSSVIRQSNIRLNNCMNKCECLGENLEVCRE